jgi:hypothetical protein
MPGTSPEFANSSSPNVETLLDGATFFDFASDSASGPQIQPFAPGITMSLGAEYQFTRFAVRGQTANRRLLALQGRFETGGFNSGHRNQTVLGLTVRARPGYIISLNGEWNQVDLKEGSFASNVLRGVADTQFSPFIPLVNIIQFDTMSRVLGRRSRYRWILRPGNDLYVVYSHNCVEDPLGTDSPLWTVEPPLKCCIHTGFRRILRGPTGICWMSGWAGAVAFSWAAPSYLPSTGSDILSLSRGSVRPIPTRTQPAASPRWLSNRAIPVAPSQ